MPSIVAPTSASLWSPQTLSFRPSQVGKVVAMALACLFLFRLLIQSFLAPSKPRPFAAVAPPQAKPTANLVLFTELAKQVDQEFHFTKDDLFALDMTPESRAMQPSKAMRWLREYRTYGLRHVTGKELAAKEAREGFLNGCSLALCPRYAHVYEGGYSQTPVGLSEESFFVLTENVSQQAVSKFQAGIDHFITNDCFSMDFRFLHTKALEEISVRDVVQLCQTACFSLVRYANSIPCDMSGWGKGLGRHRKDNASPAQIVSLSPFLDTLEESARLLGVHDRLNDKFSSEKEFDALFSLIGVHCRKALLQKIRSLNV